MKTTNTLSSTTTALYSDETLLNNQDSDLDLLDQIPAHEFNTTTTNSEQSFFQQSTPVINWSSAASASPNERALELSQNYLESIRSTFQMLNQGQIDRAPALFEIRLQLQRIQQEITPLSSFRMSSDQRNQLQEIRRQIMQIQTQITRQENVSNTSTLISQELLTSPQIPLFFRRIENLRTEASQCRNNTQAWNIIEQLRQLETQSQQMPLQIIWQHNQETQVLNLSSAQEEIRNLRLSLMRSIRNRQF